MDTRWFELGAKVATARCLTLGGMVTLAGCRVADVRQPDGTRYEFAYSAHSKGAPGVEAGFACVDIDGDGRVDAVATERSPVVPDVDGDGNAGTVQDLLALQDGPVSYSWSFTAFRLDGAVMRPFRREQGNTIMSSPPAEVPIENGLRCGKVQG